MHPKGCRHGNGPVCNSLPSPFLVTLYLDFISSNPEMLISCPSCLSVTFLTTMIMWTAVYSTQNALFAHIHQNLWSSCLVSEAKLNILNAVPCLRLDPRFWGSYGYPHLYIHELGVQERGLGIWIKCFWFESAVSNVCLGALRRTQDGTPYRIAVGKENGEEAREGAGMERNLTLRKTERKRVWVRPCSTVM